MKMITKELMAIAINIGIMILAIPVLFEILGNRYRKAEEEI